MLWMLYGLPIVHPNSTLVLTINAAGTAIELCYVILYLFFSDGPSDRRPYFFSSVTWLLSLLYPPLSSSSSTHMKDARSSLVSYVSSFAS
ncbi:Bidirectional sugar transporter SWEET4 [Platanthera zijinensis]|uniref:Bidirectional sugar transporter SWEET4 n=1 Tax=Platanthera zijinensis TaxID=2320716 RepID=A0AAP0C192_9ASPA